MSDGYQLTELSPILKMVLPNLNSTFAETSECPTTPLINGTITEADVAAAPAPAPARTNATASNAAFAVAAPGYSAAVAAAVGTVLLSLLL